VTGVIQVPGTWRWYQVNGQPLGGEGYATYRLKVLLNRAAWPDSAWAIQIHVHVNTANKR
jgi:hypothetical protein